MSLKNTQVIFANRPHGEVQECNFRIVQTELPALQDGEVLVQNIWLSPDPYVRVRMSQARSYAKPIELGDVMIGATIGMVIASKNPRFGEGDTVLGYFGWQQYGISQGKDLRKIANQQVPPSAYLGVLGVSGITAWIGLNEIGQPKQGETVVVSAAAGAVGSVAGQLAKIRGCRTIGIAGGKTKCNYTVNELGFDACVDYKAGHLVEDLATITPAGIDVYFENVGGEIFEAILNHLNTFARIPLSGLISQYNATKPYKVRNIAALLVNRVNLQGFIVSDHMDLWPKAQRELEDLLAKGQLKYRESIVEGLENAPRAFIGLFKGENIGKQLVKLA